MKYLKVFYYIVILATTSCTLNKKVAETFRGNWLNASDSVEWIVSLQPEFAIYKNQFWEYDKISGLNQRLKISLKNHERNLKLNITIIDSNSVTLKCGNELPLQLTRKKAVNPNFKRYENDGFGDIQMKDDSAVILGFIENYNQHIFNGTGQVILYHPIHGLNKDFSETNFIIDTGGQFKIKVRAFNPQKVNLTIDGSTFTQLMIAPGDTIIVGFNKLLKTVTEDERKWQQYSDWEINHYMGEHAKFSEELIWIHQKFSKFTEPDLALKVENIDNMSQLEYIKWRKDIYETEKEKIDSLLLHHQCSKKASQYFQTRLNFELLSNLYRFQVNGQRFQNIGPLYIAQLPDQLRIPQVNLISEEYIFYLNYLSFYDFMNPLGLGTQANKKYYIEYLLTIAQNHEDSLKLISISNETLPEPDDFTFDNTNIAEFEYDKLLSKKVSALNADYNRILNDYKDRIPDSISKNAFLNGLVPILQKDNYSIHSQLYAAYKLQNYLRNSSLGPNGRNWISQNIHNSVIRNVLLERIDTKTKEEINHSDHANNTFFISQIKDSLNPTSFFDSIISQFEGKVIYVDFWADWCSPCREGFKSCKRLKQEYDGKDVVFLYLGYSCRNENWDKAIKHDQVTGYHYWLDNEQSAIMKQRFAITGIPLYLLVDKNGKIYAEKVPGPADKAELIEIINKLLSLK